MTRRSRHKINRVTQPLEADILRARLRGVSFRVLGFRIAVGSSYTNQLLRAWAFGVSGLLAIGLFCLGL